jgi:alkylation response protein AidB-like acyl-CoA dehydrogenase
MQVEDPSTSARRELVRFTAAELGRAAYDARGVFAEGRRAELDALRAMGARDPSLGRIYEGHFNGVLLVALYGSAEQRAQAIDDAKRGELFGVWNTQDADPVTIAPRASRFVLSGAKTWASAADSVTRALITARTEDGRVQMCLVPLDRVITSVDPSAWRPLGMHASNSYRIDFAGVELERDDLIGEPGDYERTPWFLAGAIRFAAVHAGIVERIASETTSYAIARRRTDDPFVRERLAQMQIASSGCLAWLRLAEEAWNHYDFEPTPERERQVLSSVDMARTAIERYALETLEHAVRTVGAHGMVEPLPLARLFRDLHMYLRQPAPDAALMRVADAAIAVARSRVESARELLDR